MHTKVAQKFKERAPKPVYRHRWKVFILLWVLLLSAGWATGDLTDASMFYMQFAASEDQCTVISGCHTKRYAVNEKLTPFGNTLLNIKSADSQGLSTIICDAYAAPIDQLNYTTGYENGQCKLNASISDNCKGSCQHQKEALAEYYR